MRNFLDPADLFFKSLAEDAWLNEIKDYSPSAWIGHAPFLRYLIREEKPRLFVELGTHYGLSYFVACQTIQELSLDTLAVAIDHWQGDQHASFYDDSVYESVKLLNQQYESFSKLLKTSFMDGRSMIHDEIDLLHIDGLHTYEAVKEDFESWLPKMSANGIVLLHDIHVRREDFGVFKLWAEIQKNYKTLEFTGSHGLGVVFLGQCRSKNMALLRNYYDSGHQLQLHGVFGSHADIAIQNFRIQLSDQADLLIREHDSGLVRNNSKRPTVLCTLLLKKIRRIAKLTLRFGHK